MSDSDYSSLMDLVNCHLSKSSLNARETGDERCSAFPLASVRIQTGMSQTVFTPPNGIISIPRLGTQDNEINGVLAQQITNMLIAKEKKKQEEEKRQKEEDEMKQQKQTRDEYNIDLRSSIIDQNLDKMISQPLPKVEQTRIISPLDALLDEVRSFGQCDVRARKKDTLPLNRDMSHMLDKKVKRGRPSAFGKVISSRVQPVAAPYVKLEINNAAVQRFDFSTQSPCDINLERRRHRRQDPYAHMNMVERFMAQTNNDSMNQNY